MIDKLKKKINVKKNDKKSLEEYTKCFCNDKKVINYFEFNPDFKELNENIKK